MLEFYKDKRVLITGHTGFKGSWLTKILLMAGAKVIGIGLKPNTKPALFNILNLEKDIDSNILDIRNLTEVKRILKEKKPEIIFHLAAQSLVRESYINPVDTYEVNIMGTVNILEAIRFCETVKSVVNVTTDKVYENKEWVWGYRESDSLNGFDPYSNSKSCSELVTNAYVNSYFQNHEIAISTARAGNVIGGGDFAKDRILPDCFNAAIKNENIILRNPKSTRPYQHVLEALAGYLLIAEKQYYDNGISSAFNIGPNNDDCISTAEIATLFCRYWEGLSWVIVDKETIQHEAKKLMLDCTKIRKNLGWKSKLSIEEAVEYSVRWYKGFLLGKEMEEITEKQILNYFII